jgi:hypothetical protein
MNSNPFWGEPDFAGTALKLTRNLPEMKLCLEWHNLSLLHIWKAAQESNYLKILTD